MADEKGPSVWAALAHMGTAFAGTPFPYLLGMAFMFAATRWDGHLRDPKGCFQLQEIQAQAYKIDTCSGKVEALDGSSDPKQTTTVAKPSAVTPPLPPPNQQVDSK